jgi:hypothetical protein
MISKLVVLVKENVSNPPTVQDLSAILGEQVVSLGTLDEEGLMIQCPVKDAGSGGNLQGGDGMRAFCEYGDRHVGDGVDCLSVVPDLVVKRVTTVVVWKPFVRV